MRGSNERSKATKKVIEDRLSENTTEDDLWKLVDEIAQRFPSPAERARKGLGERGEMFAKLWRMFLDAVAKARKIGRELELGISDDYEKLEQCLSEAFSIYKKAFSIYGVKPERDLEKLLKIGKTPEEIFQEDQRILEMAMTKDVFGWLSSYPKNLDRLYTEETKEARKCLRESKRYFDKATNNLGEEWGEFFSGQIDQITEGLDDLIKIIEVPAYRRENEWLNRIIESLVDFLLKIGFSKNQAYKATGELLVDEGLMEEGQHLSDRVRHRYARRKKRRLGAK